MQSAMMWNIMIKAKVKYKDGDFFIVSLNDNNYTVKDLRRIIQAGGILTFNDNYNKKIIIMSTDTIKFVEIYED